MKQNILDLIERYQQKDIYLQKKEKIQKKGHSKITQKNMNDISKNNKFVGHNTELTV